ncbi:unnamed protein product [Spirodela intermedia]|uniref:VQ domain-containing protein n=1 Tax=Spirodela intermedia TaxID=51605 RepID=A0A7I8LG36_SPIIN|nr:unnamed protein product [Spirodela intermedia]
MAISHSSSSHPDWAAPQIYQRDLGSGIVPGGATHLTESTVITTTTAMAQPASEPRTGRAARRRSRASRKAPTTILNTDASNFRAMVQQFTGVPTRPLAPDYPSLLARETTLSFSGYPGGPDQIHHQVGAYPFDVQQQQYNQFQQQYGGGYQQGIGGAPQMEGGWGSR